MAISIHILSLCCNIVLGNVSATITLTKGVLGHDTFLYVLRFYSTYYFLLENEVHFSNFSKCDTI